MRVGVVSDSHGETENLEKAARWLVDVQNVEAIIHLGDNYGDTVVLENLGVRIIRVPGVFSNYYQHKDIPNRVVETFNGREVLITHTEGCHENDLPGDPNPEEMIGRKAVDVVLCGHTHIPIIERRQGIVFINPGHLKTMDKKGYPPSMAVIEFNVQLKASIFDITGELIQSRMFSRSEREE